MKRSTQKNAPVKKEIDVKPLIDRRNYLVILLNRLRNDSKTFKASQQTLEQLRKEKRDLKEYFGITKGNLPEILEERVQERKKELEQLKAELERATEALNSGDRTQSVDGVETAKRIGKHLSDQCRDIRTFLAEFSDFMKLQKDLVMKAIKSVKDGIDRQKQQQKPLIDEYTRLFNENRELEETLRKLREQNASKGLNEEDIAIQDGDIENLLKKLNDRCRRLTGIFMTFRVDRFDVQFDIFERKIASIVSKQQRLKELLDERSQNFSKTGNAQAVQKLKNVLYNILYRKRVKEMMDALGPQLKKESDIFKKQIDENLRYGNDPVGDSGLSLRDLRAEILRIIRENARTNLDFAQQERQIREEKAQYENQD